MRLQVLCMAACLSAALGCAEVDPVIRGSTLATAEIELSRRAGHPVILIARDEAGEQPLAREIERLHAAHAGDTTLLGISPRDIVIEPSIALAARIEPAQLRREISPWAAPFLLQGDIDGAVRAIARGYTTALRARGMLRAISPLCPP